MKKMFENTPRTTLVVGAVGALLVILFATLFFVNRSRMSEVLEVMTEERNNLALEYESLYTDYDSLKSNNDEMNQRLEQQRDRIAMLMEELKTVKATNAYRIRELQKELTTMRTVMRSFVRQIDSLNQRNMALAEENKDMRSQVGRMRRSVSELSQTNEDLSRKVEIASRLETRTISGGALTQRNKPAQKCSQAAKLCVNLTIAKNKTAQVGMRTFYLRITRPDGQLLMHSADDTFAFENTRINFSASRTIEYGGEEMATVIYYDVDSGELMAGSYEAEVFADGDVIGRTSFRLN